VKKNTKISNSKAAGRNDFEAGDVRGVYKAIFNRRDVRGQFTSKPVDDEVLSRLLYAAHHAPSVGYMQPWNFLVIKSEKVKKNVHQIFLKANEEAKMMFEGGRRELYSSLKLEGILESPVNICITCDRKRTGSAVIGRTHMKTMDLFSSVCAVQNFWLAARAENIGVGWVSIAEESLLQQALGIPEDIVPIAYLCVGHVEHFALKPELESAGWLPRIPLEDLIYFEQWQQREGADDSLLEQVIADKMFPVI